MRPQVQKNMAAAAANNASTAAAAAAAANPVKQNAEVAMSKNRGNNNWRDPTMRLFTLKTISNMDLWKDVAHGKKAGFQLAALQAWQDTLSAERIAFSTVARWSTVDMQAQKWVKSFYRDTAKEAKKTGHGVDDDDPEVGGPTAVEIAFRTMRGAFLCLIHVFFVWLIVLPCVAGDFRCQSEQNEYITLLRDLSACLSAKEALDEETKEAKQKLATKQKKLLAAGKFIQEQAKQKLLQSPVSSRSGSSPPNGKNKRLIDLVSLCVYLVMLYLRLPAVCCVYRLLLCSTNLPQCPRSASLIAVRRVRRMRG